MDFEIKQDAEHNRFVSYVEGYEAVVEYTLKESSKPIGVATYRIVQKLPENLKRELPSAEQVKKWLAD